MKVGDLVLNICNQLIGIIIDVSDSFATDWKVMWWNGNISDWMEETLEVIQCR